MYYNIENELILKKKQQTHHQKYPVNDKDIEFIGP